MKKTTFTKIASVLMMLAMLASLAVFFTVGVSAEDTAQAQWSATADGEVIGSGTLQEAFDAAAAEGSTVGYIKLMSDVDAGTLGVDATGGTFTLDLNGKTVTSTGHTIYLKNSVDITITDGSAEQTGKIETTNAGCNAITMLDNSAVQLTVAGGTIEGLSTAITLHNSGSPTQAVLVVSGGTITGKIDYAISLLGASATIVGGELQGSNEDIYWATGTLDLSAHPNPTGITIRNGTDVEQTLTLTEGYSFYDEGGERVTSLAPSYSYIIDETKYKVTLNHNGEGSVTLSPTKDWYALGDEVTVNVEANENHRVVVTVTGATYNEETKTFVVGSEDVTVDVTFRLYQAEWGTDKDNLTAWGSLQEAFNAAAAEGSTVAYIKLTSDVDLGSSNVKATGGTFVLDLGGKTVTSNNYTLYMINSVDITIIDGSVEQTGKIEGIDSGYSAITMNDASAVQLTVAGGTIEGSVHAIKLNTSGHPTAAKLIVTGGKLIGYTPISAYGASVTITGGTLENSGSDDILWSTGTIDLSSHPNPAGIGISNYTGEEQTLALPNGYSLYDENGEKVTSLAPDGIYTVDVIKYQLSLNLDGGVDEENSIFSHSDGLLAPGTPVSLEFVLLEHYELISVTLNGVAIEPDAQTGAYSFAMPEGDANVEVTVQHNVFVWGMSTDEMTESGDFHALVAAINAGEAPYAKLLFDYEVELLEDDITVSGKSFIDLDGYRLDLGRFDGYTIILGEGADITFFVDQKVDDIRANENVNGTFELQSDSKLTFDGARFWGDILYNGGSLDISGAHLGTYFDLCNLTEAEVTISNFVTFGTRFRAIDSAWYDSNYEGYTVPFVTTLAAIDKNIAFACVDAVFTVSFDFGEGSGTMPPIEVPGGWGGIPTPQSVSHPEGLTLIGWTYESRGYEYILANYIFDNTLADVTLKARWGSPIYLGGIGMNDGDYLASGATETTTKRPVTGGYAYYKDGVLTLNNYQFTGEGFAYEHDGYYDEKYCALIYSTTDLVIELVGNSTLESVPANYYSNDSYSGIYACGTVTVRGTGSMQIKSLDDGFEGADFIFEGGTVTVIAQDDAVEFVDSITVDGGVLITISYYGIYNSGSVHVKSGELHVLPIEEHNPARLAAEELTVSGGLLVVKGNPGIKADYVTISGGVVEVESDDYAIGPYNDSLKDAFVNISGGKVIIYSDSDAIYSVGDVTVSGGDVDLEGSYGIYAEGNITIAGGELEIDAYYNGIYADGNVTISGGDVYIYGYEDDGIYAEGNVTILDGEVEINAYYNGIYTEGDVTISGGEVGILSDYEGIIANNITVSGGRVFINPMNENAIVAETLTVSGTKTALLVVGPIKVTGETFVNAEEVLARIPADPEVEETLYEGVEITHTWSETYFFNDSEHWHTCTDEDCTVMHFAKAFAQSFGAPAGYEEMLALEIYGVFFATEMGIGEHTIAEGETACTVCGYTTDDTGSAPGDEIPEDVVLMVGDHYLKSGEYLTLDGKIVTTKPEGGYLYVEIDTTTEIPVGKIILSDFNFEYTGLAAIQLDPNYHWKMQLEGNNTITANADKNNTTQGMFVNGTGISVTTTLLVIGGDGTLTINAEVGISGIDNAALYITEGATVTTNAQTAGIEWYSGSIIVNNATLTVNSQGDGIYATESNISFVTKSTVTINAGDDGIELASGELTIHDDTALTVVVDDEGINLEYVDFRIYNSIVTVVAGDDAIDALDTNFEWENSTIELTADDRALTISAGEAGYTLYADGIILNIEAANDAGIDVFDYSYVGFEDSVLNITSAEEGLYITNSNEEAATLVFSESEININSQSNVFAGVNVEFYDSKLDVVATETAFELEYSNLCFVDGSEVTIISRDKGIYSEYDSYVTVYNATLSIEAVRYGIYDYIYFDVEGDLVDISVRAFEAIYCEDIDLEYDYVMNAYYDGYTFLDENDEIASYVTIRGYEVVNAEMEKAIENLNQLISEGGEFENIANSIADVNALLDTLTNSEGEGRLDLIEAANEAINTALANLTADLEQAKKDLSDAITNGDAALDQKITDLNTALDAAEAAYAAADKAIDDKFTAAQTTLDAAIKAVDKKVDDAKTALENTIKAGDDALTAEIENLNKALDDAEAAYAAADKAIDDKLTAAQTTLDAAIKAVDKKVDDAKTALENAIKANSDNLTAEVEKLNKAIGDAEAAYAAADKVITDDLTAAKNTLASVQTRLDTAEKTITELQGAVDALKSLINQDGEVDLTEVTAQINTINTKMEALDALGLSAFKASVTETLATLGESVSALNGTVAGIDKDQIAANKTAVEALNASLAEMKTELEALDTLSAKDAELEGEIDAISGNINTITTQLNDVDGKLATLDEKLVELEKIATGDHGTIDKIQQALADVNKALEDLEGIEDHTRLEALESAAERVDTALKAIGDKLDTINPADITANKDAVASLGTSLAALQEIVNALGTTDGTITESVQAMNASVNVLSEKVTATEARFVAAESAIDALQSAVAALQQANASNEALQAEINALKSAMGEEDKASGWQIATTVIAIVGLVCNAGLITALVIIETKKKILVPAIKSGFTGLASKFKKH